MVQDTRRVDLPKGPSRLAFADVAAQMNPRTALLHAMQQNDDTRLGERNFEFELITQGTLLTKSFGTKVRMKVPNSDENGITLDPVEGTLASLPQTDLWSPLPTVWTRQFLGLHKRELVQKEGPFHYRLAKAEPNVLVQTPEGLSTTKPGEVALTKMPLDLRAQPTLVQDLVSPTGGPRDLELAYLTQGLNWSSHYVATLDSDLQQMDLDCFVTVENKSGVAFERAKISLLAGEVNRVAEFNPFEDEDESLSTAAVVVAVVATPPTFSEQQLLDYHLFTWSAPTTLKQNQEKQLLLFSARRIPLNPLIQVALELDAAENHARDYEKGQSIPVWLTALFKNTAASNLGRPLPYGIVAAVYRTHEGLAFPLPEELFLDSVSKGEDATLNLGIAHGLTANLFHLESRKETRLEIVNRIKGPLAKVFLQSIFTRKTFEEAAGPYEGIDRPGTIATYRLDLVNDLSRSKQMELLIQMLEGMRLLRADAPHEKRDANSELAKVLLPAHSETSLTLQVWRPN